MITSGLGGVYPTGLLLGTVASVSSNPADMYHNIVVTPVARTGNYEEVYVMTGFNAEQAAAAAQGGA